MEAVRMFDKKLVCDGDLVEIFNRGVSAQVEALLGRDRIRVRGVARRL